MEKYKTTQNARNRIWYTLEPQHKTSIPNILANHATKQQNEINTNAKNQNETIKSLANTKIPRIIKKSITTQGKKSNKINHDIHAIPPTNHTMTSKIPHTVKKKKSFPFPSILEQMK